MEGPKINLLPGLLLLNEMAVKFNDVKSGPELYADITHYLKILTGGMTTTISTYNPADKCFHVMHSDLDRTVVNDLFQALGRRRIMEIGFPISEQLYKEMELSPIWYYHTLHEATFGVIPKKAGRILQRIQKLDRFLGIAFFFDNELFGASMVALRNNVPDPPTELIQTFAQLTAMALRRVRAEEKLRRSEEKYRNIFNNAVEGIYQTTIDCIITTINPAFARMFGYLTPEEMIASVTQIGFQLYANPEDRTKLMDLLENPDGFIRNFEVQVIRKDGSLIWVSINARMMQTDAGSPGLIEGTCIEITERKQTEEKIRKLNDELELRVIQRTAELEASNKELEAFSYSVSHDLRAPLRALTGFTNILIEDYATTIDEEAIRLLSVIEENAKKMNSLIDCLLRFSRLGRQEISITGIDMTTLARSVYIELCEGRDQKEISFLLKEIPKACGDPSLLRQVWINLIGNAIKYSSRNPHPVIEIGCESPGNELIYYIKDNGVGFDMANSDKLFGVFQRLHSVKEFEGTGVGLAIVQRIIFRQKGRVWAEGRVGEGATFYFTLPGESSTRPVS